MRPNVVLVTVECWRGDHLGEHTPYLARFAQEAIGFTNAFTAGGWTRIAMTALMSSAYASMHGGPGVSLAAPSRRTLAECFLQEGYWTAGITANPACGTGIGMHRGFGDYREPRRNIDLPPGTPTNPLERAPYLERLGIPPCEAETLIDASQLTDMGLRWLRGRTPGQPFFLWLHYQDPHWPCQLMYRPGTQRELQEAWEDLQIFRKNVLPSRGKFDPGSDRRFRWIRRYRDSLAYADMQIARLLNGLRNRADWDQTIVAITGDHGEEFFERGTWHHSWNQLHKEGAQVPLILRIPEVSFCSRDHVVGLIDLSPTLLDYAGLRKPTAMMGSSLRPLIERAPSVSRPIMTEMMAHENSALYRLSIREDGWTYIYDSESPSASTLFRISDDPEEQFNVREKYPDKLRQFEQMRLAHVAAAVPELRSWYLAGASAAAREDQRFFDPVSEQFEALGYL